MDNSPYPAEPTPDADASRPAERLRLLAELADIGMALARDLPRQARRVEPSSEAAPTAGDIALAYSRIARAVRLTLALEERLAAPRPVAPSPAVHDDVWTQGFAGLRVAVRKHAVRKAVEEVIAAETDPRRDAERIESLLDGLYERLTDHEDDEAFARQPIFDLVQRLCRDLGAPFDPDLWRHADWEVDRRPDDADPPAPGRERRRTLIRPPMSPFPAVGPPHAAHPGQGRDPDPIAQPWV